MDKYDPDLIFDLAAGNLPEAEARAAEASLSAEGRAELAAQRTVLAAIDNTPPVAMTDIERARLHRSVASAISETTRELSPVAVAARPVPTSRPGRTGIFVRWASAAAAAAMLVGVVAVGSQLGGLGGSSDSADTIANADVVAATSTIAFSGGDALSGSAPDQESGLITGDGSDSAGSDAGAPPEDSDFLGVTEELQEAPPLREAADKSDLAEVTAWLLNARRETPLLDPIEDVTALPCYDVAAEDDDLDIADGFLVEYVDAASGATLQGIAYADPGTDTVQPLIRVYDYLTCEPVVASTD
ncbi:MAG: hypothetical protein HKO63_10775 [Acidimicrobiia bacterium]|nr:hypothetical protein [Acidimicrobiia bacterium]